MAPEREPFIVFDLDDTLYAELDYVRSALGFAGDLVSRVYGLDGAAEQLLCSFQGGNRDPIGSFWREHALPEEALAQVVAAMRGHIPSIALYPDADRFLAVLRDRGSPFGILTDGRALTQRCKLAALGCLDAAVLSISEEVGLGKFDEARFEAIASSAGRRCVYVADNPAKDFVSANSCGWRTVMLLDRGNNVHSQRIPEAAGYAPHMVIRSFDELKYQTC